MKNERMIMAESIQAVFPELTKIGQNALKTVSEHLGDSMILDMLHANVCAIKMGKDQHLSTLVSAVVGQLRHEYLYKSLITGLKPKDVKYLTNVLMKKSDIFKKLRAEKEGTIRFAPIQLSSLIMSLDAKYLKSLSEIKPRLSQKNKKAMIEESKSKVNLCRDAITRIIVEYAKESDKIEIVDEKTDFGTASKRVRSLSVKSYPFNYMFKEPVSIFDAKCDISINYDSQCRRAVQECLEMPHTLDEEFNKAVMTIIDTPLFEELIRGKSLDEASTQAKLAQVRHSVKEGLAYWDEVGKGNVYFTYVVDFRGRISQMGGISAVGNKVGKAMLRSGRPEPLGRFGYDDILIALAGAMGHDKETFDERLEWARGNVDRFVHIGATLLHSPDLAFNLLKKEGADEIFSAASICLELHRIRHFNGDVRNYKSNLYIGYDATSSAVQLVGLIMGNRKLAVASNVCVGTDTEDRIHDAYMLIAESMDKAYSQCRNDENAEYLDMWMEFETKVKRAIAKPLLMTRLYGSKFLTHMDRSKEVAVEKGIINAEDTERLQGFGKAIAQLFNFAFDNEDGYNALRGYEDFVKQVAKAYAKENDQFVTWKVYEDSDAELQECSGRYEKFDGEQYTCWLDGKKHVCRTYGLRIVDGCENLLDLNEKKSIDVNRSTSAIAPNYIHSHDALVLHKVVNNLKVSMRLTHDCFAICPGRVRDMQDAIIDTYAELFGDNNGKRLEKLRDDTFRDTGVRVELPSEYNEKGIPTDSIKKARYMFS